MIRTPHLAQVRQSPPDASEIIAISTGGITIRVAAKDIPVLGRATQGVRIMKLNAGDTVASVGLVLETEKSED